MIMNFIVLELCFFFILCLINLSDCTCILVLKIINHFFPFKDFWLPDTLFDLLRYAYA